MGMRGTEYRKVWTRVRDAITGRFVRREEAKQRPETTIEERVEEDPA